MKPRSRASATELSTRTTVFADLIGEPEPVETKVSLWEDYCGDRCPVPGITGKTRSGTPIAQSEGPEGDLLGVPR
jgi:hypothetical protein